MRLRLPGLFVPLALCAAVALGGCSATRPSVQAPPSVGSSAGSTETDIAPMSVDQVRTEIDSGFPVETPVPAGTVVRGEAQGPNAWDYELVVAAPASSVAEWYKRAYGGRSWVVTDERVLEGGGSEVTMQKGAAATRVTATPEGQGTHNDQLRFDLTSCPETRHAAILLNDPDPEA